MIEQGLRYYPVAPFHTEYVHFARALSGNLGDVPEDDIASSGYVMHTLEASLCWCLLTSKSYEEAVLKAVNLGEDTDTTGCVTGGLAGLWSGVERIPASWRNAVARQQEIGQVLERFADQSSTRRPNSTRR